MKACFKAGKGPIWMLSSPISSDMKEINALHQFLQTLSHCADSRGGVHVLAFMEAKISDVCISHI